MRISAYVMAGGGSRRFGEEDKARAPIDGVPLVVRNAAILGERYGSVTVVSAPGRSYEDLGLRTISDVHPDRGPLGGVHAALLDTNADAIAVAACDLHGLRQEWYEQLEEAVVEADAAAFRDDERWHPLVAIYRASLTAELERRIRDGQLAAHALLESHAVAVEPPPEFAELRSIDRPEDWREVNQ